MHNSKIRILVFRYKRCSHHEILFEISCTQDFQILFSKGHNSEKGHNLDMKKNMGQLFFHEESVYEI